MKVTKDDQSQDPAEVKVEAPRKRTTWTMPTEVDFYSKMLRSIKGKKYEVYAVSRVLHLLDDPEIELVTQQPVRKSNGEIALLDLYLPQFRVGVEIDEEQHFSKDSLEADRLREQAVVEAADIRFERLQVPTTDPLSTLKEMTDDLIARIRGWKSAAVSAGRFRPFSYGDRYRPKYWRDRGIITIEDDVQMPRTQHVLALFGKSVTSWQSATCSLEENFQVWMPVLHQENTTPRKDWKNVLSNDGKTIVQTQLIEGDFIPNKQMRNVVFARFKDPIFLDIYYRFLGVFKVSEIDVTGKVVTLVREEPEINLSQYGAR